MPLFFLASAPERALAILSYKRQKSAKTSPKKGGVINWVTIVIIKHENENMQKGQKNLRKP